MLDKKTKLAIGTVFATIFAIVMFIPKPLNGILVAIIVVVLIWFFIAWKLPTKKAYEAWIKDSEEDING